MRRPVLALSAALLAAPLAFAGGCLQRNPPGSTDGERLDINPSVARIFGGQMLLFK